MKTFPVTNSTLSAGHLGEFIRQNYLFGEVNCSLLKNGINDTYLVAARDAKYVFRVYSLNWRTAKEISEEIRLLDLLKENNIPVSYAIADKSGNYIQQFTAPEGERFGALFSFAVGEKLLNFSADLHFKAGEIMARMHATTHSLSLQRTTYTTSVVLKDSFEHLKKFLPPGEELDFMTAAQRYLLDEFARFKTGKIGNGIVHLDIWFDNISIHKDNITIFDFDFCGNGMLCYDLAYYILQLNSTEKDPQECEAKTTAFLAGYQSVIALSNEEKRIIPILGVALYFFYLGLQCSRYENWSNTFLNEVYLKRFINLLVKRYFEKNGLGDLNPKG